MSWQRLAFRSSAALLVTPSALFASCYLPMGTFDSDSIQIPFEPSAQFRQEVASSDSPFQEGAPTGPRHLAPIEWKRGTLGVPLHGGSHVDQSGTFTGASASPPLSNGGARYWPAEHKSSGDQSPSSAIDRLKKWLGAAKEEGHLTAPLLTSQQAGSAADCGSLPNGWSSMTASQRKVDNRRDTAGQKNGGEIRHTEANSEGLRTKAATDVYATKSSNSVGLEESNVDLSADRQEYDTQLEPGSALASGLRLNVLILVIGTRGDVQPMAALGRVLQEKYGHRVRVATHAPFKDAVEAQGLEFFPMPGNPNFLIDSEWLALLSTDMCVDEL